MATAALLVASSLAGLTTQISNIDPRYAMDGTIMDAHDGNTIQYESEGDFHYYGMGYGLCQEDGVQARGLCGQWSNNTVGVWTSPSLASGSWKLEHSFTPASSGWPNCTYFRSHAVRRKAADTTEYVLFLNGQSGKDNKCTACPDGSKAKCILAGTSASPTGPFQFKGVVPLRYTNEGGIGDFDVWVDEADSSPSGQPAPAYVMYKRSGAAPTPYQHRMTLERLDDSYLSVAADHSASAGIFGAPFVEAPALFRRGDVYYALFGECCAFCAHGTGIGVYTAAAPLGPWTFHENIGCNQTVSPQCGCGMSVPPALTNGTQCPRAQAVTYAQQNSVIRVPGGARVGDQFVWTGDRWQSACRSTCLAQGVPPGPIDLGCVKGWDYQYWSLLSWDESTTPPLPRQVHWQDNFSLSIG